MPRRQWTAQRIIQEIQDLHAAGESLATTNLRRLGCGGMVTATYHDELFGSWRAAVQAAGLRYRQVARRRRQWTPDRIIARIQQLHSQHQDISYRGIKTTHQYLLKVACQPENFGSWQAAVAAAGIDYDEVGRKKSPCR